MPLSINQVFQRRVASMDQSTDIRRNYNEGEWERCKYRLGPLNGWHGIAFAEAFEFHRFTFAG